jgi:hypothetical protein
MIFTNKHVVIAMIVAPILAILAWFAVGQIAGEKPSLAIQGKAYPLVEKSNCRYSSGLCELENEEFKLVLELDEDLNLSVRSAHTLTGIMIAVGNPQQSIEPVAMTATDNTAKHWHLRLAVMPGVEDRLRLVAATKTNAYFGDAASTFIERL